MQAYAEPILFAIIAFPVVALVFTLPYMIVQYRRHGSIPLMRPVIVYSFIFYLMCADLLTILVCLFLIKPMKRMASQNMKGDTHA